ncbi:Syncytin-1 [Plecturocebus cupreus]
MASMPNLVRGDVLNNRPIYTHTTWMPLLSALLLPLLLPCEILVHLHASCLEACKIKGIFTPYSYMKATCCKRGSPKLCAGPDSKTCWTGKMKKSDCPVAGYYRRGQDQCWTYYTYYGMSDGSGVQDQPLETDVQLTGILNTTYQYMQGETNLSNPCWLCLPLQQRIFMATPVPDGWNLCWTEANQIALLRPVAENVLMKGETNLTCVQSPGGNLPGGNLSNLPCTTTVNLSNVEVQCAPPGYLLCMWQTGIYLFRQKLDQSITGIAARIGTGIGGISTLAYFFHKLSQELKEDMERVANSLMSLQNQLNSLAALVLQNRRALD